jgi:alcohol dehydrogenase class IV
MTCDGILRTPNETLFGRGALTSLPSVAARFGRTALLVADPNVLAQPAGAAVPGALAEVGVDTVVFGGAEPDVPLACIERCVEAATGRDIDLVIGLGGGSAIDVAKLAALLLRHDGPLERYYGEGAVPGATLPVIAVPTTAGTGSEVSPVAVITDPDRHLKVGVSSVELIPRVAICDPDLTLTCPPSVTAFSGIDALAHAVEALTAAVRPRDWATHPGEVFQGRNVFTERFAVAAIEAIGRSLERAVADGSDADARADMMYGSLCAGMAFGNAGTAAAHALQYPIGASTSTPHGLGVGLLLPYVLCFTRPACVPELALVARALGVGEEDDARSADRAIEEIARLSAAVGVPRALADIGVAREALPGFARDASTVARLVRNSSRELDEAALLSILEDAWAGQK